MKRGADAADWHGGSKRQHGGKGGGDKGVPKSRYAFKVLVTDGLAAGLLGSRGAVKDEIQQETGTRLVFSNRNDYFPNTNYRVLGIYADDPTCILRAFEWILPRIVDMGEEERKNPPKDGPELLGKEPGEYIFRFCVTKRMSSHIIGSGGINIKQIRNDTGVKIFIENDTQLGHRLCRVIGQPEQILPCMERVNEFVQRDCDEQDFFAGFAGILNFADAAANGWVPPPEPPRELGGGGGGGGCGGGNANSWGGGSGDGHSGAGDPWGAGAQQDGDGTDELQHTVVQEEVDRLAEAVGQFPPGTPRLQYSVSSELPAAQVGAVAGNSGEYVKYVEEATGTKIDIDSGDADPNGDAPRALTVVGQLLNVYTAHAMMLMKLRTTEAQEREAAERAAQALEMPDDPDLLKARILELQAQLAKATGT